MIRVFGDVMLDKWISGTCDRISPEFPVPILLENEVVNSLGGAANLAANIANIAGGVKLYGSVGSDKEGYSVLRMLKDTNVEAYINMRTDGITTTKTRFVDPGGHHIMRWDREEKAPDNEALHFIKDNDQTGVIVVSDYNKGIVTKESMEWLTEYGQGYVLVDPKQGPETYCNAWLVKPNMKEYREWFGKFNVRDAQAELENYGWAYLCITDGENGIHLLDDTDYWHFKEPVKEVADVTGAGDAVLAVIAYGIVNGMELPDAVELACYAAARNVERRGVSVVQPEDLSRGVIFTNGCFDVLHYGHFELLKFAKGLGKKLVVGINDDNSVKRLKGNERPLNNVRTRRAQLELLDWVDEVHVFSEDTPRRLIEEVKPDIIVKGGDYTVEEVVGHDLARVEIFPTVPSFSSTRYING